MPQDVSVSALGMPGRGVGGVGMGGMLGVLELSAVLGWVDAIVMGMDGGLL